jgi:hypothetical protein
LLPLLFHRGGESSPTAGLSGLEPGDEVTVLVHRERGEKASDWLLNLGFEPVSAAAA